jgi:hypothetical protein
MCKLDHKATDNNLNRGIIMREENGNISRIS